MEFTNSKGKLALVNIALTSLKIIQFLQSMGLWKALEKLYKMIVIIIKSDLFYSKSFYSIMYMVFFKFNI